jgi:transposase
MLFYNNYYYKFHFLVSTLIPLYNPKMPTPSTRQSRNDLGVRIQALCLLELGIPIPEITKITGVARSSIYRIRAIATTRGYQPDEDKKLLIKYVEDEPRSGAPVKATDEVKAEIVKIITKNSTTRSHTTQTIANILSAAGIKISARTVWNCLHALGYGSYKPTYKPGLTESAKAIRWKWCKEHENWTLEDWKNVIWSDETSVTMGGQRGRLRIWRTTSEAYNLHCIKRRWKGFKEFMFWGCFSYDKKGPYHIWKEETKAEKKQADIWLAEQNQILEPECKLNWELEIGMRRVRITRNIPGKKPVWKWTKANGKLVRSSSRGIDWYRYQKIILHEKLLPFARECQKDRPETIVQEDNASPHAHSYQHRVYNFWKILRLLWPANSPDLNMIEPVWFWMKKETTKHGAATSQKQMEKDWAECWEETLTQEQIQHWIERIVVHIQEVIRLEGGNEYEEGTQKRKKNPDRVR